MKSLLVLILLSASAQAATRSNFGDMDSMVTINRNDKDRKEPTLETIPTQSCAYIIRGKLQVIKVWGYGKCRNIKLEES